MFGSCLHHAADKGDLEMYELIMARLEDINPKNKHDKTTPLHIAARKGHLDLVKLIIRYEQSKLAPSATRYSNKVKG